MEILAGKNKSGVLSGQVLTPSGGDLQGTPRIGFVPQQDILPPMLTVFEALLFAARLRLPESIPDTEKQERVVALLEKLGIENIRNARIGDNTGGKARGISGGEMRRVSIGSELIASPDILILDEPTSGKFFCWMITIYRGLTKVLAGLDSVSAARVARVLHDIAHDPTNPIPVIASIHQPRYAGNLAAHVVAFANATPAPNCTSSLTPFSYFHKAMRFIPVQDQWPLLITSNQTLQISYSLIRRGITLLITFSKLPVIHLLVYSNCHRINTMCTVTHLMARRRGLFRCNKKVIARRTQMG